MKHYREVRRAVKFNISLHVIFKKAADSSLVSDSSAVLVSEQMDLYEDTDINELLKRTAAQLVNRIESHEMTESDWIVSVLKELDTTVWQLNPLRASTYHPLPRWIQNKKAVRNIRNNDMCFKWSIFAGSTNLQIRNIRVEYHRTLPVRYVDFCLIFSVGFWILGLV